MHTSDICHTVRPRPLGLELGLRIMLGLGVNFGKGMHFFVHLCVPLEMYINLTKNMLTHASFELE